MEIRSALAVVLAFIVGLTLSNPGQYLATSDQSAQAREVANRDARGSTHSIDDELIERMCSRMGNWTYAKWAHGWWSNNTNAQLVMDGYSPRNFSAHYESAWAKVYQDQIEDLRAMGCP